MRGLEGVRESNRDRGVVDEGLEGVRVSNRDRCIVDEGVGGCKGGRQRQGRS